MATNDPTTSASADSAGSTPDAAPAAAPARGGAGRALAITGIAVGSVLTLGLTFAGGVALGQALPGGPGDRGPAIAQAGELLRGPHGERSGERVEQRIEQRMDERMNERMDERMDERQEQRDELRAQFEQWLQEQGIEPGAPATPAP
ncbi:hypothetical protein [Microcella frigidaquae]|uniref:Uncharacterized protein n=1 Tax=Microcella frigidaquae TaxID=424758 RepID=A0A840XLV7_9MICO|nr:hypothetical protein [Microcella frigidaquae]MBB5617827.1 hypothetical protein [Microcella frigidaquae]NHN45893.1 hypothetical protein [Microcella frigidaquae]